MLNYENATQLIVPMDPQPEGTPEYVDENCNGELQKGWWANMGSWSCPIVAPHAVGDLIPVGEEWWLGNYFNPPGDTIEVEVVYADGERRWVKVKKVELEAVEESAKTYPWEMRQPASTMPDWAAREHRRVCKVEAKRVGDIRDAAMFHRAYESVGKVGETGDYVWLITLGRDWNGGTREEAEAIYEWAGCEGPLVFDNGDNEGFLLGHKDERFGLRVDISDTVYRDGDEVNVRRVSE